MMSMLMVKLMTSVTILGLQALCPDIVVNESQKKKVKLHDQSCMILRLMYLSMVVGALLNHFTSIVSTCNSSISCFICLLSNG